MIAGFTRQRGSGWNADAQCGARFTWGYQFAHSFGRCGDRLVADPMTANRETIVLLKAERFRFMFTPHFRLSANMSGDGAGASIRRAFPNPAGSSQRAINLTTILAGRDHFTLTFIGFPWLPGLCAPVPFRS
jgi:hypothetical protein